MPKEFISPSGRVYVWNKDTDPTQEEFDALVAYDASLGDAKQRAEPEERGIISRAAESFVESQKSEDQKARELLATVGETLTGRSAFSQPLPSDVTTLGEAAASFAKKDVLPTAIRVGTPILTAASLTPQGRAVSGALSPIRETLRVAGMVGASSALAEDVARTIEGRPLTTPLESLLTSAVGATIVPMKYPVDLARRTIAGTLEGLGIVSAAKAIEGKDPFDLTIKEAITGPLIAIGGRSLENLALSRQATAGKAAAPIVDGQPVSRPIADSELVAKQQAEVASEVALAGINTAEEAAGVVSPVDIFRAKAAVQGQLRATEEAAKNRAREAAATFESFLPKDAKESAAVIDASLSNSERLARQFDEAKKELLASDISQSLKRGQIGEAEDVVLAPGATTQTRLDVVLGPGEGAVRERARIAAMEAASPEAKARLAVEEAIDKPLPKMSAQASRIAEEYGFIDPRILAPMARAGVGFAAGVIQGDTPEEDIGYGLTYAITGAIMSPSIAKRAGEALIKNTKLGRTWVPEATLGPLMEVIRSGERDAQALLVNPKRVKNNLQKALDSYSTPTQRQQANIAVHEYLTGNRDVSSLPQGLQNAALDARIAIDDLTDELNYRNVVSGELRDTLLNNRGSYLRRAYKIFIDPTWRPDEKVVNKWVDAHVNDALSNPKNTKTKQDLEDYFNRVAVNLLDRDAQEFIFTGGFRTGREIFKERQNLSAVTRELLGEIDDPLILFSDTVPRMAQAAASFEMKKNLVNLGKSLGLMSDKPIGSPGRSVELAPLDAKMNPFAGVYSTPEIRDALNRVSNRDISNLMRFLATASSTVKAPKTLGSLKGYASNVWTGVLDPISQGFGSQMLDRENWRDAATAMAVNLKLMSDKGVVNKGRALNLYRSMVREGLVNKGISGEDFVRTLEQSVFSKVRGSIAAPVKYASALYTAPASISKVFHLRGELDTIKKAFPAMTDDEAFRVAAARTRATTEDYDYLPSVIRKGSQAGVLDPFIAFTADRFRIVYNTYRIGMEDLASNNPVLRKAGAKRIASMTAVLGAAGVLGANLHLSSEENDALRRRLPSRDVNGFLMIGPRNEDGTFTYTNLNYNIAQTVAIEAAAAAMRGDSPLDSTKRFLNVVGNQLFGAPIVFGPIIDVYKNTKELGRRIYSQNQDSIGKVADIGNYLSREWFMLAIANEIKKAYNNFKVTLFSDDPKAVKRAKSELIDSALSNFAGIRRYRVDVPLRFKVESLELGRNLGDDQASYFRLRDNVLVLPQEKKIAYEDFEAKRRYAFNVAVNMVKDARTLGYSEDEIVKMLKGGVNARLLKGAMDDIYIPSSETEIPSPSEQFEQWENSGIRSPDQIRSAIEKIADTDRVRAKALVEHYKESRRDIVSGTTESDKLLLSYGESDGSRAAYVSSLMRRMSGADSAAEYLLDLRRKRIVTPQVFEQVKINFADNPDMLRAIFYRQNN